MKVCLECGTAVSNCRKRCIRCVIIHAVALRRAKGIPARIPKVIKPPAPSELQLETRRFQDRLKWEHSIWTEPEERSTLQSSLRGLDVLEHFLFCPMPRNGAVKRAVWLAILFCFLSLRAQTLIDLRTQTKGNIMAIQLGDFLVIQASPTVLTVGPYCTHATPCNVRFSGTTTSFEFPATVTINSGAGTIWLFIDGSIVPPVLKVRHTDTSSIPGGVPVSMAVSCAGMNCVVENNVGFPDTSIPLFTWITPHLDAQGRASGTWAVGGGTDFRSVLNTTQMVGSLGATVTQAGGLVTVGVDSALVPTFLIGSISLGFSQIASGTCAEQIFSMPGVAINDGIASGLPPALEGGLLASMRVSAADTIAVRLCNLSGVALTPARAIYSATIVRHF